MPNWRAYDSLNPGDRFPDAPARYTVTEEAVRDFRAIAAGSLLSGAEGNPETGVAPPMLAAVYIRAAQNELRNPPGGIHAKQHFSFLRPVHVGDELGTLLTVKDKFERKGRRYVVGETVTCNQAGDVVTRGEITFIWGQEK